jgi:hypothetical protein
MSSKYCSLVSRKLEANKGIERTCACVLPKNGVEGNARALELSFKNDRAENLMIDCRLIECVMWSNSWRLNPILRSINCHEQSVERWIAGKREVSICCLKVIRVRLV